MSQICYTMDDLKATAERLKRWGQWGADDEFGTMNFITPQMIVNAARLIKQGKIISLGLNFDRKGPQNATAYGNRFNPIHSMLTSGVDATTGRQGTALQYADDMVSMPLQCGTQWDALGHIFYEGKMWNGYSADLVDSQGAGKNSIDKMKDRMTGRGVLLDIPRSVGLDFLENGIVITGQDLDDAAVKENVIIGEGDILIVRTGQMERYLAEGDWKDYAGGSAPGLGFDTLQWLYDHKVAAICTDTWGAEVLPNQILTIYQPWHWVAIPMMGLTVGEIFYLKDIADDCAQDGVYEFFFTAPPLPITKAVGSPINPLAIK